MRSILLISFFFVIAISTGFGQNRPKPDSKAQYSDEVQQSVYTKSSAKANKKNRKLNRKKGIYERNEGALIEYEERMKANSKKYKKAEKEMKKPQYSDPSYFGHRKPPKRSVDENGRRICEDCEKYIH